MTRLPIGALSGASFCYLIFVVGGIIPSDDGFESIIKFFLLLVAGCFAVQAKFPRNSLNKLILFLLFGLLICFLGAMNSIDFAYAVKKTDGVILASVTAASVLIFIQRKYGYRLMLDSLIAVVTAILFLTIIYKIKFGFFDRSVRFFLNGPIVYGWLMGFAALLVFHRMKSRWNIRDGMMFLMFLMALLWTESKGPVVALLAALSLFSIAILRRNLLRCTIIVLVAILSSIYFSHFLSEILANSRFSALQRIIFGTSESYDEGSVVIREEMFRYAVSQFFESPVSGIGLGNFRFAEFLYPHNQHLEVFVELGLLVGLIHIAFISYAAFRAIEVYRSIIVLFIVAGMFSGDISYLRFLYTFALVSICFNPIRHNNSDMPKVV